MAEDLLGRPVGILNNLALSAWGGGAFHAGLEVYGVEYSFSCAEGILHSGTHG